MRASSVALGIVCGPFICAYVVFASCFCPSREPNGAYRDEDRRRFERRQKLAPRPIPARTPSKSLTIANERPLPAAAQVKSQANSRLLQLPLELRRMIYREALGDRRLHFVLKENKLGYLHCKSKSDFGCLGFDPALCWSIVENFTIWRPTSRRRATDGDIIPLLQSCRQIYSEAIDFLYSTNIFSFKDIDCLRYLAHTTLPRRFAQISKLEIIWPLHWPIYDSAVQNLFLTEPALYPPHDEATWEEIWRIVSEMPNLKHLWVKLFHCHGFRDSAFEKNMLVPLRKITHVKRFEVHVSWEGEDVTDGPFKLFRPPSSESLRPWY